MLHQWEIDEQELLSLSTEVLIIFEFCHHGKFQLLNCLACCTSTQPRYQGLLSCPLFSTEFMFDGCLYLSRAKWGLTAGLPGFTSHGERSPSRTCYQQLKLLHTCFSDTQPPLCKSVVNVQYEIMSSLALSHLQCMPPKQWISLNKSGPCERQLKSSANSANK